MSETQSKTEKWTLIWVFFCAVCFFALTIPLAFQRPSGGRSAERQGFTAGIIRIYCQEPHHSILKGPQIHFGRNPFNLEFTGFEWAQGVAARMIDGPSCAGAVEKVGKTVSILFSALSILLIAYVSFLFGAHIGMQRPFASLAAAISAFLLASDEMWLRYSTYTMVENRMLFFGLLALATSIRIQGERGLPRWWFLVCAFSWAMLGMHKPQGYAFFAVFWSAFLIIQWKFFQERPATSGILAFILGSVCVVAWLAWGHILGKSSDLPWILHTGPRATKWYFGDWHERFQFFFFKSNTLKWAQQTGLLVVAPTLLLLFALFRKSIAEPFQKIAQVSVPYFFSLFIFVFLFWAVYIIHEYYALPFNVGRALATGLTLAILAEYAVASTERFRNAVLFALTVIITAVCGKAYQKGVPLYLEYAARINNPRASDYLHGWDVPVFPKKNPFVVMTVRSRGSELLYLYKAKARGFVWCTHNPIHAPRKYWKEQGIEYVAWGEPTKDPTKPGLYEWTVRTMDEELALARKNAWSSDVDDHWSGRTMAEWAALASANGKDPCLDDPDPRLWEKP